MSVLQFPSDENPGSVQDFYYEHLASTDTLKKIVPLPPEYSEVKTGKVKKCSNLFAPVLTVNLPESNESILQQPKMDEITWSLLLPVHLMHGRNIMLPRNGTM